MAVISKLALNDFEQQIQLLQSKIKILNLQLEQASKTLPGDIVEDEDGEVVTLITKDGSIELGNWYPDHELSNTMVHLKVNSDSGYYPVKVADLAKLIQVYNKAEWSSTVISF